MAEHTSSDQFALIVASLTMFMLRASPKKGSPAHFCGRRDATAGAPRCS